MNLRRVLYLKIGPFWQLNSPVVPTDGRVTVNITIALFYLWVRVEGEPEHFLLEFHVQKLYSEPNSISRKGLYSWILCNFFLSHQPCRNEHLYLAEDFKELSWRHNWQWAKKMKSVVDPASCRNISVAHPYSLASGCFGLVWHSGLMLWNAEVSRPVSVIQLI